MAKIGIWSDLHIHPFKTFGVDKATGISKRLLDQIKVTSQIVDNLKKHNVNIGIDGGDGLHLRGVIPVEALNIINGFYNSDVF